MKTIISRCLLFLSVVSIAWAAPSEAQNTATSANPDAKAVFAKNCTLCHGPDGRAQTTMAKNLKAADLTSQAVQNQSDAQIRNAIANGKGNMPPFGPALGAKGLDAMLKYIRSLKAK